MFLQVKSGDLAEVYVLFLQVKSGDLAEVVRHRDQLLRKNESEIDSLNFRNQQLAKRVEILQVRARRNFNQIQFFFQTVQEKGSKTCTSLRFPFFMYK